MPFAVDRERGIISPIPLIGAEAISQKTMKGHLTMMLFASYVLHTDAVVRNYCRALLSPPTLAFHIFKDFLRLAARRQPRPRDLRGPEAGALDPPGRLRLSAGYDAGSTQGSCRIGPEVPINIFF